MKKPFRVVEKLLFSLLFTSMFRINLMALWTTDYLTSLGRVLADTKGLNPEEAQALVLEVVGGERISMEVATIREANVLAENLLQYGAYVNVSQIGPVTFENLWVEYKEALGEDLSGWFVLLNASEEHVRKIIDPETLGMLSLEGQELQDRLGEEILMRGASPISREDFEKLENQAKEWRKQWGKRIQHAIARKKALPGN